MKNFGKGIGGALLSLAFVLGISGVSGSSAQAQDRMGRWQLPTGSARRGR